MGVACRVRAFNTPAVVRCLSEDYVPVTASLNKVMHWTDDDSKFVALIRERSRAKPHEKHGQGMYMVTADGQMLLYKSSYLTMRNTIGHLQKGLTAWNQLPTATRQPNAIHVPKAKTLHKINPPSGGLVIRVYSRQLDRVAEGNYADAKANLGRGDEASIDNLWLTASEWKSLIPKQLTRGSVATVRKSIVQRIAQRHLFDMTRGNLQYWQADSVRSATLRSTVIGVTAASGARTWAPAGDPRTVGRKARRGAG